MSSSPVIPKEKLSAYQRWELHSFDAPGGNGPAAAARKSTEAEAEKVRHIHQQTFDAGRAEGLREGTAKAAAIALPLMALLASIKQQSMEINQHIADDVLGLALEIARQMMRQALDVHPELIIPVVHDALARMPQPAAQASITLHPADAALVREHLGEQFASGGWKIIEDPACIRGGCLLQTTASQVDATVGTRWQRLTAALGQSAQWLK